MAPPSQITTSTNDIAPTVHNLSQTMPSISSMPINAADSFSQIPYTMQMPNMSQPQMTPMMMAQMTQYMMMMMNNSSNYPYNAQAQPTDFNSALIDALRIHNVQWPNSQTPQESPLQSSVYSRQSATQLSPHQNFSYPNISSTLFPGPDSQSTSAQAPVQKKRRASSDSLSMQDLSKSKSKTRSISPAPKRHKVNPSAAQPSSERKLFYSKSGKELSFFVQVEMHNRSGVVTAIKVKYIH